MTRRPSVSVIVPAHGASADLAEAVAALRRAVGPGDEILVADDGSEPPLAGSPAVEGAGVVRLARRSGPGAARNLAARHAAGEILLFVDADVAVPPDAVERVARTLADRPEYAAVFGSYDATPARPDFLSQYKNLFHHYIHQASAEEAGTFWAGCGAIRRATFLALGGFDAERYPEPSIEDIELGVRLRRAGGRILLDKGLTATHLKRWRLATLLHADIVRRAVPWTRLLLEEGALPSDLNLRPAHRASGLLVALAIAALAAAAAGAARPWGAPAALIALLALAALVPLNWDLYRFFARRRGAWFAARVVPMHVLYYLYSGATFAAVWALHHLGLLRSRSGARRSALPAETPER